LKGQKLIGTIETAEVLIVDDDETTCRTFQRLLARPAVYVTSAAQAKKIIRKTKCRFFLIDSYLAGEAPGHRLIGVIQRAVPSARVLLMSAYASAFDVHAATAMGAHYCEKSKTDEIVKFVGP
jgi:DNA-binding NtrC family response regulator